MGAVLKVPEGGLEGGLDGESVGAVLGWKLGALLKESESLVQVVGRRMAVFTGQVTQGAEPSLMQPAHRHSFLLLQQLSSEDPKSLLLYPRNSHD